MHFRILGPLQVEDGHGPVALGGPKPRLLLAVLIVAAGEVVPADRLVAALWRDAVPPVPSPRFGPTFRGCVVSSHLRSRCGTAHRGTA